MSVRVNFGYGVNKICIENMLISDRLFSIQSSYVGSPAPARMILSGPPGKHRSDGLAAERPCPTGQGGLEVTERLLSTANAN